MLSCCHDSLVTVQIFTETAYAAQIWVERELRFRLQHSESLETSHLEKLISGVGQTTPLQAVIAQ